MNTDRLWFWSLAVFMGFALLGAGIIATALSVAVVWLLSASDIGTLALGVSLVFLMGLSALAVLR